MPIEDSNERKKADNELNNAAEKAAWDAGLLSRASKRVYLYLDGSIDIVITRQVDSSSSREDWWTLEPVTVSMCLNIVNRGLHVHLILVDENDVPRGKYEWPECYVQSHNGGRYYTVIPRRKK